MESDGFMRYKDKLRMLMNERDLLGSLINPIRIFLLKDDLQYARMRAYKRTGFFVVAIM